MSEKIEHLDKIKAVIKDVLEGETLKKSLEKHDLTRYFFYQGVSQSPEIMASYAAAQDARAESLAEEIIEIADTETDQMRSRNRITARQWYASKLKPAKFGDRLDVNVTQIVDINAALTDARNRASLGRHLGDDDAIQITEYKELNDIRISDLKSDIEQTSHKNINETSESKDAQKKSSDLFLKSIL